MTSVGTSEDDHNTNGIFIDIFQRVMRVHDEPVFSFDRNQATLNIEIPEERLAEKLLGQTAVLPSKFLKGYLSVCAEDNVRVIVVLSSGLAGLLPAFLHCQTTQQDSLRRPSCGSTEYLGIFRGVPKLRNWIRLINF